MAIQGRDLPKYTISCRMKLIMPRGWISEGGKQGVIPVARVSFLHQAYHVAHSFSGTER